MSVLLHDPPQRDRMVRVDVAVTPAVRSERDLVGRLLEFNAYEFSRIDGRPIGEDARYGYPYLDAYWSEDGRFPYLICLDHELAGLALVSRFGGAWYMSEFLILPRFRRAGIGTDAARRVFARHPGSWRVHQVAEHDQARRFWRHAIPVAYLEHVESDAGTTQTFTL